MSRPDFLSQLPSLEELLEHPRVASTIDRLNRSTAAVQLRGAIQSLGAEVSRRAEGLQSLGAGELLDRLIRQLEFPRPTTPSRCVNATGQFFLAPTLRPPLAATAIDAARAASEGFCQASEAATKTAATLLGADAAWVGCSHPRALATVLEALAGGGTCVVARGDMTEVAPGLRLDEIARRAGVTLREVGAANTATADDFAGALAPLQSAQLQSADAPRLAVLVRDRVGSSDAALLSSLAQTAHHAGAKLLFDCGRARLRNDTPAYGDTALSVEASLSAGADLVIFDAAGLVGGPVAGVVAGRRAAIEAVASSGAAKLDTIDPAVEAALAATLQLFQRPGDLRFNHPLHQLLDAPIENLRTRAERLALRIAAGQGVGAASAVERPSAARGGASWAIRVEPAAGTPAEVRERLASLEPALLVEVEADAVLLDLATVFPRQDAVLVDSWGGEPAAEMDPP
ncbi:L-seryl-tRNA(Sec) selenium transferase [Botrimarina colliarenosi]|uniref:L-seryl-tRNA(Sec) selenium transferase n=1 Tax=Botrimarina colliarenosi TaxID=2528001 RepID=A0A5C6AK37_9BACT|nr:hypothetical protein [Botrimarina colliarenosi]TWT99608.1 L-seryl-tRNA(Sec) selenium transferase [Botrimarina colliarenosi]